MKPVINIGVIGYGYWGPNLFRNLAEVNRVTLTAVVDSNPEKLALVQRRFPAVKTTTDFQDLIRDPAIDAIAIATPARRGPWSGQLSAGTWAQFNVAGSMPEPAGYMGR